MKKYKWYLISLLILIIFCVSICFVPINASRLIPVIESQVEKDLGVKIHIEKLIFRFGPLLKVKAPTMHLMYQDGQKFGQFSNVKFFISWSSLFKKDDANIKKIYADQFIVRVNSNDKYLNDLLHQLSEKDFKEIPNVTFKNYSISYTDAEIDKKYRIYGAIIELSKLLNYKNFKTTAVGKFSINDKDYISYDINLLPNQDIQQNKDFIIDPMKFIKQIETFDFHSDIIANLKLSNDLSGHQLISGLINIDNITALEDNKKTAKSFLYLTFLGDKIGVYSNLYATNINKIYLEGTINNSKKPYFDLKVKTDEINLKNLYEKLKIFIDSSKLKDIESISGLMKADFSLKGDFNKIKSNGFIKINNGNIKAKTLNINNINTEIDLSNNVINLVNATGYVNNAPIIVKGKIHQNIDIDILMDKIELTKICPENYGVKSGIISLVANINGTFEKLTHKENVQIEKFKLKKENIAFTFNSLKFDSSKNNIAYVDNIILSSSYLNDVKIPTLKILINNDYLKISDTNVFMQNSKMVAKADVNSFNTPDLSFNLKLDGIVNSKDIKSLKSYSGIYPVKMNFNGNKNTQNFLAQCLMDNAIIFDEPTLINLNTKLENNVLKIEDFSASSFNGKLSNDFKSNLKNQKKIIITGAIENIINPIFKNIRIYIPQTLNISYQGVLAQLNGDIFINGKIKTPEIVGQISISNLINQFIQLSLNNCVIDFKKNIANANIGQIKIGDSIFSLTSVFSTNFTKEFLIKNLNIKSKYFNTDTLVMHKDNSPIDISKIHILEGKLFAEKGLVNLYDSLVYMTSLNTDFKMQDNLVSLYNMSAEMYNGKIGGFSALNLRDENFASNIQARGVSALPIFNIITNRKDTISGTVDFDANIMGNIASKQSLNGDVKFIVSNGRMSTLGKLEHLLYAQNVIADNMLRTSLSVITKAITLKDTGLFKSLQGDIKLVNGDAIINMLKSQGPLMALYIKGQFSPVTNNAQLVVLGRVSDEIISGLGSFGEFSLNKLMVMLTGEDNTYHTTYEDFEKLPQLPMRNTKEFRSIISGDIDKPSSVILFNWISYSTKSYRQKEVPIDNASIPDFINKLPY